MWNFRILSENNFSCKNLTLPAGAGNIKKLFFFSAGCRIRRRFRYIPNCSPLISFSHNQQWETCVRSRRKRVRWESSRWAFAAEACAGTREVRRSCRTQLQRSRARAPSPSSNGARRSRRQTSSRVRPQGSAWARLSEAEAWWPLPPSGRRKTRTGLERFLRRRGWARRDARVREPRVPSARATVRGASTHTFWGRASPSAPCKLPSRALERRICRLEPCEWRLKTVELVLEGAFRSRHL